MSPFINERHLGMKIEILNISLSPLFSLKGLSDQSSKTHCLRESKTTPCKINLLMINEQGPNLSLLERMKCVRNLHRNTQVGLGTEPAQQWKKCNDRQCTLKEGSSIFSGGGMNRQINKQSVTRTHSLNYSPVGMGRTYSEGSRHTPQSRVILSYLSCQRMKRKQTLL